MPSVMRLLRPAVIVVLAASLSSCIFVSIFFGFIIVGISGGFTVVGQLGGCNATTVSGGTSTVSCGLEGPGGFHAMSTMVFRELPPSTTIGSVYGGMILQVPASVTSLTGTYSGAASGNLSTWRVNGPVFADNTSSIAPEAGMVLYVIEPPAQPGQYQFNVNIMDPIAPLAPATAAPWKVKFIFVEKIVANGRTYYPPLFPCTTSFAAIPAVTLPNTTTSSTVDLSPLAGQSGCNSKSYSFGPTVSVIEYRNQALDHYFITWQAAEIELLDAGTTIKGWQRTGKSFKAYVVPPAGAADICRIYIIPLRGDSHFFGRGQQECDNTMAAHPDFVLEEPKFMAMILPTAGVCPAGTVPVYRVFSNRADANHRYMTEQSVRTLMVSQGWIAEGDGPDLVVMCAPA